MPKQSKRNTRARPTTPKGPKLAKPAGRPRGTGIMPYKVLLMILYGEHSWIVREADAVRIPVAKMVSHLGTKASRLRETLYVLENWGVLDKVTWNSYWATAYSRVPIGMARMVGPRVEPAPTLEVPELELMPNTTNNGNTNI